MAQSSPQRSSAPSNFSDQTVREFIDLQKEEMKIRQQENELRKIELQHNYELSKEGLKQQGEYLKAAPRHGLNQRILLAIFFIFVLAIVSGVLLLCIHMGKEEVAMRILEIVATAIISGGGGYAWGKSRAKPQEKPQVEVIE